MSDNLSLYSITSETEILNEMLSQDMGEIDESYEQLYSSLQNLLSSKTDACVGYIKKEEDLIQIAKNKIKELKELIAAKEKKIERFKEYVCVCLDKLNKSAFEGTLYQIKKRKPSKVLVIDDENEVPPEFIEVVKQIKINKSDLIKSVKNGDIVSDKIYLKDGKPSITCGVLK